MEILRQIGVRSGHVVTDCAADAAATNQKAWQTTSKMERRNPKIPVLGRTSNRWLLVICTGEVFCFLFHFMPMGVAASLLALRAVLPLVCLQTHLRSCDLWTVVER